MPVPIPSWTGRSARRAYLLGNAVVAVGYALHVALDLRALASTGRRHDLPYASGEFVLVGVVYLYAVLFVRRARDVGLPPTACMAAYALAFVACANVRPAAAGWFALVAAHAVLACLLASLPTRFRSGDVDRSGA